MKAKSPKKAKGPVPSFPVYRDQWLRGKRAGTNPLGDKGQPAPGTQNRPPVLSGGSGAGAPGTPRKPNPRGPTRPGRTLNPPKPRDSPPQGFLDPGKLLKLSPKGFFQG